MSRWGRKDFYNFRFLLTITTITHGLVYLYCCLFRVGIWDFLTPNVNCVFGYLWIKPTLSVASFQTENHHYWLRGSFTRVSVWVQKCVNSHRESCCSRLGEGIFTEGGRAIKYYRLAEGGSRNIILVFKGG